MPQPVINDGSLIFRFLLKYQCENRVFLHLFSGRAKYSSSVKSSWNCQHRTQLWEPFLQTEPLRERQSSLQNGRFTLPMSLYRMCVCFFLTCTMSIYDVNGLCIYIFILHKYTGSESAGKPGNTERCGEGEGQHSSASSVFEPFFHWASPWQATQSPEIWQQSLGDRLRQHKGSFPLWTG